ncbi:MAG: hypothetical protein R6U38_01620 [Desulfatiglandaceae bacterium]
MPAIEGNLALKDEIEDTISCFEDSINETESQSESKRIQRDYLTAKYELQVSGGDPSDWETSASLATYTIKVEPYSYSDLQLASNSLLSSWASINRSPDTEIEEGFVYEIDYGVKSRVQSEQLRTGWFEFCESLFPGYREHTVEERKAYSDFIDSFF